MEIQAIILGVVIGFLPTFLLFKYKVSQLKSYIQTEFTYKRGTGKVRTKDVYWTYDPCRRRGVDTTIQAVLDNDGIRYKFARLVSDTLVSSDENGGWGAKRVCIVEYWD